ncbi:UDP-N-acetylenolpyruvoylglucosamine reductase MurB [Maioricimonas rarisocia]|uniref:UDP-N-acetylenolpyruvoylglucosamine reductase n=1 Tax=Maioricimonas rarisocia TaxID=2528026 RepID=A0A517ZBC0_9PLAN|nr:UDP-N-acetylmuramate dehydrogenase [Maioricimonas rarisocia]QDU39730.1 UDP-N-acetylenolpyruvoylglucosamine reductase MurB [Maioricimonas rarisocia]
MTALTEEFSDITRSDVPLAPYTWLNVGGPAQLFIEPRTREELSGVIAACQRDEIPVRLLGGGSNLLVRDEGFGGAVIHLAGEEFTSVSIDGTTVRAGAAAALSHVISQTVNAGLAGLETLVGIPGTLGGAIRGNAGGRHGDIGQFVRAVDVITSEGKEFTRQEDELAFDYRHSSINELVIVSAELALAEEDPDSLTRRMRKLWIMKKAAQPLSFQSAGCIFKNPRGLSAGALIEQAGLKGTRVGQCEVSDRHANFIVTHDGATSDEVLKLIDLVRTQVSEIHGVQLELEIQVW